MKNKKNFIFFLLLSMIIIRFCMSNTENYIQAIAWSHFPTLILNHIFLIYEYFRVNRKNAMINLIVPRIGYKHFMKNVYQENITNALFYSLYVYVTLFIWYPQIPQGYELKILSFLFINTLVYIFEELILSLQYFQQKSIVYLVAVILINIIFHYLIIMKYLV